ncbi:hypothetical protein NM688_g4120 [Phlebia brevispora]|uniref:Uncharacterized protein n=1 Tax=Phlebia brevispora TaxID=194682 RepID=A0ACC1T3T6_9APHY|nr:hypothetical protein NM688_g4120 [Phlebia brevispora]
MPLVLGAAFMGLPGSSRHSDATEIQRWIDVMVKHGHPYIDTARLYSNGTSEELLSKLDLHGAQVDTKAVSSNPGDHAPEKLKKNLKQSLTALGPNIKIRVYYLHRPDRSVPFEQTLETINDLHEQGLFEEFGLSNYMAFEVAEIVCICKRRGFVLPSVYQGGYNLVYRAAEAELFPCLRKFGLKFSAYSVLAGGLLTGKLLDNPQPAPGSHYDPNTRYVNVYTTRFGHVSQAIRNIRAVAETFDLQLTDVAYRWLVHHSAMRPDDRGIIIGGSSLAQIEKAIVECDQGPLPEAVVVACEEAWNQTPQDLRADVLMRCSRDMADPYHSDMRATEVCRLTVLYGLLPISVTELAGEPLAVYRLSDTTDDIGVSCNMSDAAPMTMTPAEYVETANHLMAAKIYSLAACVMLFYDIALTFGDEVEKIWKRRFTGATVLWFMNRYLNPLGYIVVIVSFHSQWPTSVCNRYIQFPEILKTITDFAIGGLVGCILTGASEKRFIWTWVVELIFDSCVFSATLFKALTLYRSMADIFDSPLLNDGLRKTPATLGIIYFAAIFGSNIITVVFLLVATPDIKAINATFSNMLTSLLVSRLMLNLRIGTEDQTSIVGRSAFRSTVVRDVKPRNPNPARTFEDNIIGNLGAGVSFWDDDEEEKEREEEIELTQRSSRQPVQHPRASLATGASKPLYPHHQLSPQHSSQMAPVDKTRTNNRYEPYDAQASHHKAKMADEQAADVAEKPAADVDEPAEEADLNKPTTVR